MTLEYSASPHYSVREELESRLKVARDQGLVDAKAEIDVSNHSSTRDLLIVLNNLLKIRERGVTATMTA